MMRRLALLVLLSISSFQLFAQETTSDNATPKSSVLEKPSRDFVMLQLNYEGWSKVPDSIKVGGIGRGFNAYLCYDFPIKKSNFSFALGLGIGTANIYLDGQQIVQNDTGDLGKQARFIPETKDYSKYKLETTYLEAPFELRFFGNKINRNRGFKAAVGLRIGDLIGAHTKGKYSVDGTRTVDKVESRRYLETWRFAGTLRLGWGNYTLMGTYNLNSLFKENQGPQVVPFSIGFCLTGL